jgi:hypothetical protein
MDWPIYAQIAAAGGWNLWLLHQPTWLIALIIMGSGLLLSLAAVLLANHYFSHDQLIANNEVAAFKFMFIAELFAGLLAFFMVSAGSRYSDAQAFVQDEAAAWQAVLQVVDNFPEAQAQVFRQRLNRYAESVADTEWPSMEVGDESPVAQRSFSDLLDSYFALEPGDVQQRSRLMLGNQFIGLAAQARTNRLNNNLNAASASLVWFTLASVVLFTILFNAFFGSRSMALQLWLGAILGASLLSNVFLIYILGNPYSGATAISAAPFIELAQR